MVVLLVRKSLNCPACGNLHSQVLWKVSASEAAQHFVLKEIDENRFGCLINHIMKLWSGDQCSVRKCSVCGLRFADPFVAGDYEFYGLAYPIKGCYPNDKWEFKRTYADIRQQQKAGPLTAGNREPRVLEIGAGHGGFVRNLVKSCLTRKDHVVCLEYDTAGLKIIRDSGLTGLDTDFREISPDDIGGKFDIICGFQVLEHLDRLNDVFISFQKLLRPGGVIYCSVPCCAYIEFNENHGALLDMPPNHVACWSVDALKIIAARHKLALVDYEEEPFHIGNDTKLFMISRFNKSSQKYGSFPNRIRHLKNRRLMKFCAAAWTIFSILSMLSDLSALWREKPSHSLWFKLKLRT